MRYSSRPQIHLPPIGNIVRTILILCPILFVFQLGAERFFDLPLSMYLGFVPSRLLSFWLWQPLTYAFLHGGVLHLVFNLLVLWSLGSELEMLWGKKFFLSYIFTCIAGGAVAYALFAFLHIGGGPSIPLIGFSGAIYGLLLAYGILFGERILYFFMIFPMKAKHFVLILGAIAIVSTVFYSNEGVAHVAHLGGMLSGFLFLWFFTHWKKYLRKYQSKRESLQRRKRIVSAQHLTLVEEEEEEEEPKVWH